MGQPDPMTTLRPRHGGLLTDPEPRAALGRADGEHSTQLQLHVADLLETIEALAVPDLVASVLPLVCRFEALAVPGLAASVLHLVCRFEALKVLDLAASVLPLVCRFEALALLDLAASVLHLVCHFEALAVPGLAASVLPMVCRFEALAVLDLAASVLPMVCRFEALAAVLDDAAVRTQHAHVEHLYYSPTTHLYTATCSEPTHRHIDHYRRSEYRKSLTV